MNLKTVLLRLISTEVLLLVDFVDSYVKFQKVLWYDDLSSRRTS